MRPNYRIQLAYYDRTCTQPPPFSGPRAMVLCVPYGAIQQLHDNPGSKFLLTWLGEFCLSIDPKGQGCAVCGRFRAEKLHQKVYRLDPFNLMERLLPGVRVLASSRANRSDGLPRSRTLIGSPSKTDNIAEAAITSRHVHTRQSLDQWSEAKWSPASLWVLEIALAAANACQCGLSHHLGS